MQPEDQATSAVPGKAHLVAKRSPAICSRHYRQQFAVIHKKIHVQTRSSMSPKHLFWAISVLAIAGIDMAGPQSALAQLNVVPAQEVEMPGSRSGSGGGTGAAQGCTGNACVDSAVVVPMPGPGAVVPWPTPGRVVPWPIPAREVPWAQSVYWAPSSSGGSYGRQSLRNIDAYLADQCRRSSNRQYYCKGSLNAQQIDWINRVGHVQLQQTHYRWGDSWYIR